MTSLCSPVSDSAEDRLLGFLLDRFGARKAYLVSSTFDIPAQLLASQIGSPLCHQSVGHELSSRDGNEARNSIPCLMVETDNSAADAPA